MFWVKAITGGDQEKNPVCNQCERLKDEALLWFVAAFQPKFGWK